MKHHNYNNHTVGFAMLHNDLNNEKIDVAIDVVRDKEWGQENHP